MTKQEKIREGIDMKAPIPQALNGVLLDFLADYDGYKVGILSKHLDFYIARAIRNAMYALHSQGCRIRVKCPDCEWSQFGDEAVGMTPCVTCNSKGYLIEPLIGEE